MGNFYDEWLRYWDEEQEERAKARTCVHEEDLEWVRTKQDHQTALLCTRQNGFVTAGDITLGIIPKGCNTGKHAHGEESMYIVQGTGFSVVDGQRYDWEAGSCVFMPYGSVHQHFSAGDEDVRYLSMMALALERFVGLAKVDQYEEAAETPLGKIDDIPLAESDIHPEHGRIVLRLKDAPVVLGKDMSSKHRERKDEFHMTLAKEMRSTGASGHRSRVIEFMNDPDNQFKAREAQITHILIDAPGKHSGKHGHMEAILYVLQGEGYSVIDGKKVPWKKGTLLQVQGPQTVHQHFNTGEDEAWHLRMHYGIRSQFFQSAAKRTFPYRYYEFSSYTS